MSEGGETVIQNIDTGIFVHAAGGLSGKRVLDLGSNEGGYSVAFAQLGAKEVVGIEARENNLVCARYLKDRLNLPQVHFFNDDVRQVTAKKYGTFGAVLACGILYHVDDPYLILSNIKELTEDLLVLDTHVAVENNREHACSGVIIKRSFGSREYNGMMAVEYESNNSKEEVEQFRWSSYGNKDSFWPTEESLKQMLWDVGFNYVSKVLTPKGFRCGKCPVECRVLFIARKEWPHVSV
jgi:SAM-dependent methyltransferase